MCKSWRRCTIECPSLGSHGASLLLVVWVVLPCVACGSLELVTSGHAGVVSPLWRQVTRYSEIALAVFVIINTLAMFVAMITYGDRYFMEDTDLRVKRLTELPLSTVWRRQSRHMIGWVFAMNIYIMVTVGVVALLSLTTGFQSGYYGMVLRRAMLAVRSQTAKYTVSAQHRSSRCSPAHLSQSRILMAGSCH